MGRPWKSAWTLNGKGERGTEQKVTNAVRASASKVVRLAGITVETMPGVGGRNVTLVTCQSNTDAGYVHARLESDGWGGTGGRVSSRGSVVQVDWPRR